MGEIIKVSRISKLYWRKEARDLAFYFIYDMIRSKSRPFYALDDVSFKIEKGEVFGLLGQNGAGKTTFLRILSQIILPDSGKILLDGRDIASYPGSKGRIVSSDIVIFDLFDAAMTLRFYADLYGRTITSHEIEEILKKVSLEGVKGLQINKYSSGMVQKLKFAKILMLDPDVILFDEPTSALDAVAAKETRELIRKLKGRHTVILSTHNMREVEDLCDRVAVMDKGKVAAYGTVDEIILKAGADNFEEAYVSLVGGR